MAAVPRQPSMRDCRATSAVGALAVLLAACGTVAAPTAPTAPPIVKGPPAVSAGPSEAPDPSADIFERDPGPDGWGPLAVSSPGGSDFARNEGVLRITEHCTFLVSDRPRVLLVWPAADTRWDAAQNRIIFRNPPYRKPSEVVVLEDGQHVELGGGGGVLGEDVAAPSAASFHVPPHPSCSTSAWWYVGAVEIDDAQTVEWREPAAYSFTLESGCGHRDLIGRFRIDVENGVVVDVRGLDEPGQRFVASRSSEGRIAGDVPTLAELLALVAEADSNGAAVAVIETDPTDGRPTFIEIDGVAEMTDDEECYTISDFVLSD